MGWQVFLSNTYLWMDSSEVHDLRSKVKLIPEEYCFNHFVLGAHLFVLRDSLFQWHSSLTRKAARSITCRRIFVHGIPGTVRLQPVAVSDELTIPVEKANR